MPYHRSFKAPRLIVFVLWLLAMSHAPLAAQRIVSLAPNLTEICCKLDLCDNLAGVTEYCLFPEQVLSLPKVGGYIDPNLEVIAAMKPDLILALPEHRDTIAKLKRLGLEVASIRNWSVADIYDSIQKVGELTGREEKATEVVTSMQARQAELTRTPERRLRCLMTVGHDANPGVIKDVFIVGRQGFLHEMLMLAGGDNVFDKDAPHFPKLDQETIIRMQPDIIIELVPTALTEDQRQSRREAWQAVPHLEASAEGRIYFLESDHVLQAGPRFLDTLAALTAILDQP